MAGRGDDVVKSVGRVFEVLELFDREKGALNATEVERVLAYPQSSTLALLKSMVALGYLSFDRIERTYLPTLRVTMLGGWLEQALGGEVMLDALMKDIGERTGETVTLSCQNDLEMQFMTIRPGKNPLTLNMQSGEIAPLFRSIVGLVGLSTKADRDIRTLIDRVNRITRVPSQRVDAAIVMAEIAEIRARGYGVGYSRYIPSVGAIAWPLPVKVGWRAIVLSVAGPVEAIRAAESDIVQSVNAILKAAS
jgi:DNA-binding IclR family transcriptional regulator